MPCYIDFSLLAENRKCHFLPLIFGGSKFGASLVIGILCICGMSAIRLVSVRLILVNGCLCQS